MMKYSYLRLHVLLGLITALFTAQCPAFLRVVQYNILNQVNNDFSVVMDAIGKKNINGLEGRPAIFVGCEAIGQGTVEAVRDALNDVYGVNTYLDVSAEYTIWGAGTVFVIIDSSKLQVVSSNIIDLSDIMDSPRDPQHITVRLVDNPEVEIHIIAAHLKAGSEEPDILVRTAESIAIRDYILGLGNANVILAGDLNYQGSLENMGSGGYDYLVQEALNDPIDAPGHWNYDFSFKDIHTQNPMTSMNDRFDFQLVSDLLMDGKGLSYIGSEMGLEHSYHAFGNDGSHEDNGKISTGTGAAPAVLFALEMASDHLPVVMDLQVPAKIDLQVQAPTNFNAIIYRPAKLQAAVSNGANTSHPNGADFLSFDVTGFFGLDGEYYNQVAFASQQASLFAFDIDTSGLGERIGRVRVVTDSEDVPEVSKYVDVDYTVFVWPNASFNSSVDINQKIHSMGMYHTNGIPNPTESIRVYNLPYAGMSSITADMKLVDVNFLFGFTNKFVVTYPQNAIIKPDEFIELNIQYNNSNIGVFYAVYELKFTDADVINPKTQSVYIWVSASTYRNFVLPLPSVLP